MMMMLSAINYRLVGFTFMFFFIIMFLTMCFRVFGRVNLATTSFTLFSEWMQILEGLVKLPDNRECADCGTKYVP